MSKLNDRADRAIRVWNLRRFNPKSLKFVLECWFRIDKVRQQDAETNGWLANTPVDFNLPVSTMSDLDLLMQNARLRDEMEPFLDESVFLVDLDRMSVRHENEFLTSLLAWEKAPVLPICQWFEPELVMANHQTFSDTEVKQQLHQIIGRLFEKNIVLVHTDHLSDRQLYCLIARDILPAQEKKIVLSEKYLKWQCLDIVEDEESWLRFYASQEERDSWADETELKLPPREEIPFPRKLPQYG